MTDRIHYHLSKRTLEDEIGHKVTPMEMAQVSANKASMYASAARAQGQHPKEEIAFNFHCALIRFAMHGRQCFSIGPELTRAFKRADLSNIKAKHIRVPFEAFWITFPPGTATLWGGKRTGWHDVWGTYVHIEEGALCLTPYGGANEFSISVRDDSTSFISLDMDRMLRLDVSVEDYLTELFKDTPSYAPWNFDDRGNFDESQGGYKPIDYSAASISNMTGDDTFIKPGMPSPSNEELRQHTDDAFRDIIRISINTMLYLTSPKAELDADERSLQSARAVDRLCEGEKKLKPSKRRKLATKVSKKRCTRLTRLGARLEQLLKDRAGCWVRAHWQIYWTGEGRLVPTPVFKLPFPSGTIDPNEETREYIVEKED